MDQQQQHRRSLYKEHKDVLSPKQYNRVNRQLQEANRQQKRCDLYQRSRCISRSPTPQTKTKNKENCQLKEERDQQNATTLECNVSTVSGKSRTAKLICTARDPEKIRKQEAFLLRYLDWKDKKQALLEKQKNEKNKKRPFVSACSKNSGFGVNNVVVASKIAAPPAATRTSATDHQQVSFVPKGHNEFQPPPGIKYPEDGIKEKIKSRQSIYTIVPTPPRKTKTNNDIQLSRKIKNIHGHLNKKITPALNACNIVNINKYSKQITSGSKVEPTTSAPLSAIKSTTKSATKSAPFISKPTSNVMKRNSTNKTEKPASTVVRTNYKTRPLKMAPPPTVPTKKTISAKIKKSNAIGPNIRINSAITTKSSNLKAINSPKQSQKNARLTQTMKAKKTIKTTSGKSSTKLMSLMINQADNNQLVADMLIQTPRDFSNLNPFDDFVTSTKVKNSDQTLEAPTTISPIDPIVKRKSTSAKRKILNEVPKNQNEIIKIKRSNEIVATTTSHSRFNFVRYSEIITTLNDENKEDVDKNNGEEDQKLTTENLSQCSADIIHDEKTPTKEDRPINYLSPYVSVSRGKVSLKREKEKRNSVYLINPVDEPHTSEHNDSTIIANPKSPQYSVEVRRTLEAVRYYRKQLQDEIDRLHKQCDEWEAYKNENQEMLNEANVDDMVDVAVGQTRLLTSKKFMQFKGLIDRCESGATGIGQRPDDGSEATKFISSTDLEGFWSMLRLQVDNLEQRFENLNRWKNNNWQDPEEIKPKSVKPKNLTKVKKKTTVPAVKAKPSAALQQMLRKYQAEMREKKKNNVLVTTDDVIVTPCKVKDRKYFSPAATVIHIPLSANSRRSLSARKNSQDSPNRRVSIGVGKARKNSIETLGKLSEKSPAASARTLHESVMRANVEAHSSAAGFSSPKVQSRKSILKTPGSPRTNLRNVIFSQKCRVKKFKFVLNDEDEVTNADGENAEELHESIEEDIELNAQETDQEENGAKCGTYSLRNRKVRLRPSSEIIIPKGN